MAASAQPKPKKSAAARKPKSSPSHPPFAEMITDAIASLKERTGSSQYAITKFIEEKHKHLPPTFRKLLLNTLKKSVAAGKLVKVKNSFKLPPRKPALATATTKPPKSTVKAVPKPSAKPKVAAKPKVVSKPTAARRAKATSRSAKPSARTSLGKRVAKAAKTVKKPKSVKSPAKKEAVKKVKK